jgi:class 3 adenylate cyclase
VETQNLTVMFTDLVGSVRMYSRFSDAVAVDLLRTLDEQVRQMLPAAQGTFIKSTGDGQLLTFARPADAVRCAHEIHRFCETLACEQQMDLFVRVAVHIGDVFLGDGDVHGTPVNLSARLLGIVGPCETCVTEEIWNLLSVDDRAGFHLHGPEVFKGFSSPTRIYKKTHPNPFMESSLRQHTMIEADGAMAATHALQRQPQYNVVLDHPQARRTIVIHEGDTHVIGRAPECTTVIPDRTFSGTHAALAVVDGVLWVFDLQSANGIFFRGRRINRRRPLTPGDHIDLPAGTITVLPS